jgi:hypothetical protein
VTAIEQCLLLCYYLPMKLNNKLNLRSKIFFILIFEILFFNFYLGTALAQTMENGLYRIQIGNLNSISGNLSGSDYNLSITSGQLAPGLFEGENFKVKSGFQYVPRTSPFSFTISSTKIDFGTLTPTNPVTRTTTLRVDSMNTQGYSVTGAQEHELMDENTGATIPDTTCDNGRCSETVASAWSNTLTFGFGYRCSRENITCVEGDESFVPENYFKQFPDSSKDESATTIMSGGTGRGQEATILYKVNISSSQPAGVYTNAITYLATPNY